MVLKHSKQITRSLLANYVVPTVYYASLECVTRLYNADPYRQTVVDQQHQLLLVLSDSTFVFSPRFLRTPALTSERLETG